MLANTELSPQAILSRIKAVTALVKDNPSLQERANQMLASTTTPTVDAVWGRVDRISLLKLDLQDHGALNPDQKSELEGYQQMFNALVQILRELA